MVTPVTLVHLSDLHFGRDCDLAMIDAVERLVPTLDASAVVVSGDLTQRARHGEFQAARRFVDHMAKSAPVLTLPGNHDVQWFESPFWIRGRQRIYVKYRRWFGAGTHADPGRSWCRDRHAAHESWRVAFPP